MLFLSTVADHIGHASHIHSPLGALAPAPAADLHVPTKPARLVPLSVYKGLIPNSKRPIAHAVVTEKCTYAQIPHQSFGSSFFACQMGTRADSIRFSTFLLLPPSLYLDPTPLFPPLFSSSFFSHFLNIYVIGSLVFPNPISCHNITLGQRLSLSTSGPSSSMLKAQRPQPCPPHHSPSQMS